MVKVEGEIWEFDASISEICADYIYRALNSRLSTYKQRPLARESIGPVVQIFPLWETNGCKVVFCVLDGLHDECYHDIDILKEANLTD